MLATSKSAGAEIGRCPASSLCRAEGGRRGGGEGGALRAWRISCGSSQNRAALTSTSAQGLTQLYLGGTDLLESPSPKGPEVTRPALL